MGRSISKNRRGRPKNNIWNGINLLSNILENYMIPNSPTLGLDANMIETPSEYIINVSLSGFDRNDVYMELNGNYLTVNARKNTQGWNQGYNFASYGMSSQSFSRTFYVKDVHPDKITSNYSNGILTLHLPKNNSISSKINNNQINS